MTAAWGRLRALVTRRPIAAAVAGALVVAIVATLVIVATSGGGGGTATAVPTTAATSSTTTAGSTSRPGATSTSTTSSGSSTTTVPGPTTTTFPGPPTTTTLPGTPPPVIGASPSSGLPERGFVTVTGSHLPVSTRVFVIECRASAPAGTKGCDADPWWNQNESEFFTDGGGNLRPGLRPVRRVLGDNTDCSAVAGGCELRIFALTDAVIIARTPLRFAGPPGGSQPMTLIAQPSTGLTDGQQVQVSGRYIMPGTWQLNECAKGVCAPNGPNITVGADGTFSTTFTVHRTNTVGGSFDCTVDACGLDIGHLARAALTFKAA